MGRFFKRYKEGIKKNVANYSLGTYKEPRVEIKT